MESIESLQGYIDAIEAICEEWSALNSTTHPWFRGQARAEWSLVPGLYRGHIDPIFEREIVRDFKLSAPLYLDQTPKRDIEWLFIMQHYSMPTRLVDWTEHHLTALHFALSDPKQDSDACVWILDPWSVNRLSLGATSVPTATHAALKPYVLVDNEVRIAREVEADLPVAVRPIRQTRRVLAQRGVFTLHGRFRKGLEEFVKIAESGFRLKRIVIAKDARALMLRQLVRAGVTAATVIPDLEGLCREISFRYSRYYFETWPGGDHETTPDKSVLLPRPADPSMSVRLPVRNSSPRKEVPE